MGSAGVFGSASAFDPESLQLALKYFTCSTLTLRIGGLAQINAIISTINDACCPQHEFPLTHAHFTHGCGGGGGGGSCAASRLADWLVENRLVEHMFGPNLHVELIKQSQPLLIFLAVEGRIRREHVDCIWSAAQTKHCAKQVHDLLIPLCKHLDMSSVRHFLAILSRLEPAGHTEQTLFLVSHLIKSVWDTHTIMDHALMGLSGASALGSSLGAGGVPPPWSSTMAASSTPGSSRVGGVGLRGEGVVSAAGVPRHHAKLKRTGGTLVKNAGGGSGGVDGRFSEEEENRAPAEGGPLGPGQPTGNKKERFGDGEAFIGPRRPSPIAGEKNSMMKPPSSGKRRGGEGEARRSATLSPFPVHPAATSSSARASLRSHLTERLAHRGRMTTTMTPSSTSSGVPRGGKSAPFRDSRHHRHSHGHGGRVHTNDDDDDDDDDDDEEDDDDDDEMMMTSEEEASDDSSIDPDSVEMTSMRRHAHFLKRPPPITASTGVKTVRGGGGGGDGEGGSGVEAGAASRGRPGGVPDGRGNPVRRGPGRPLSSPPRGSAAAAGKRRKTATSPRRAAAALWSGTNKNRDVSTGPLARLFAHLLALLTRSPAPDCTRAALARSLARSLVHSLAHGKINF